MDRSSKTSSDHSNRFVQSQCSTVYFSDIAHWVFIDGENCSSNSCRTIPFGFYLWFHFSTDLRVDLHGLDPLSAVHSASVLLSVKMALFSTVVLLSWHRCHCMLLDSGGSVRMAWSTVPTNCRCARTNQWIRFHQSTTGSLSQRSLNVSLRFRLFLWYTAMSSSLSSQSALIAIHANTETCQRRSHSLLVDVFSDIRGISLLILFTLSFATLPLCDDLANSPNVVSNDLATISF